MTLLEAPSRVLPTDTGLPAPPTDTERDLYLSSQHRWLVPATAGTYPLDKRTRHDNHYDHPRELPRHRP